MADRELDVVLFGASGYVGRLVAAHLARRGGGLRIALAGRSPQRLRAVADGVGADWPVLGADAHDAAALADLAGRTRVVLTTVGPYVRLGMPLASACAEAGTDYADLTGEVLFVRESIERLHERAAATGARLVHACGFDSVPSDLGVLLLADRAEADGAGELRAATLLVLSIRGGISGGTADSMRGQVDMLRRQPAAKAVLADPYALSPDRAAEPDLGPQPDAFLAERLPDGSWITPFVMASFNTRIVRRSNALTGYAYGRELRYREAVRTGRGPRAAVLAVGMAAGLGGVAAGLGAPVVRPLLDRVLPAPGSGPSERTRRHGRFTVQVRATTSAGARYVAVVEDDRDPGYGSTAVMLGESGLALVLDRDRLPDRAGVLTPATALGHVLAERLRDNGFRLDVRRVQGT